jgi:ankyrin repeat protein
VFEVVAQEFGQWHVVVLLIEGGANIHTVDQNGLTLLHWASYQGLDHVAKAILQAWGHVNKATRDGVTSLICACQQGHAMVVQTVLETGADVEGGPFDIRPYLVAQDAGHTDVMLTLIKAGANVTVIEQNEFTRL